MCQYEETTYRCGHVMRRVTQYCRYARDEPDHHCWGAWSHTKRTEALDRDCPNCRLAGRKQSSSAGKNAASGGSAAAVASGSGTTAKVGGKQKK